MHISSEIDAALEALANGDVIAMPTETLYGLAVDATNDAAVEKLYQLKGRGEEKPFSLQVHGVEEMWRFAEWSETTEKLATAFMPGPLTLILERREGANISRAINVRSHTLGIRIPDHPVAQAVLQHYPNPLAVPSANKTDQPPALTKTEVENIFGDDVAVYLDNTQDPLNEPSTVVWVQGAKIKIIRAGVITEDQINKVLAA